MKPGRIPFRAGLVTPTGPDTRPAHGGCLTGWRRPLGHKVIADLDRNVEDFAEAVVQAGPVLGYVQLDDNDGVNDLHLPLLAGQLTEETLAAFLGTLRLHSYSGALALELSAQNEAPERALAEGKALLERLLQGLC